MLAECEPADGKSIDSVNRVLVRDGLEPTCVAVYRHTGCNNQFLKHV